ncbi:hypothetical protein [Bacillus ectoiniformans]|uniref:hypothetical protein n=1 Tax=Bacillus ectoiniformans TaxID=1494429 RepID=UPI00195AB766|nr:hypothetical protein [Bacillus ectoiniformans]
MLSAILQFKNEQDVHQVIEKLGFKGQMNQFKYNVKNKTLIEAVYEPAPNSLTLQFSPGLNLEEYTMVHEKIVQLKQQLHAKIDDSNSLLGYLKSGEGAYIVTNWQKWYEFLQGAKLTTLEGKKVRVLDKNDKELASGLFVGYTKDEQSSNIVECTVITLFGERSFQGSNLTIEPTNEW